MHKITLVTGGCRSGKSRYALSCAAGYDKKGFIATAIAFDEEMRQRIEAHQKQRGESFVTVEEPYDIANAIASLTPQVEVILIDCLTVWLGNLLHRHGEKAAKFTEIDNFLEKLHSPRCDMLIVTNEVGMGIVPQNALARKFRDLAGSLNQQVAQLADQVVLMVSGIPLVLPTKS